MTLAIAVSCAETASERGLPPGHGPVVGRDVNGIETPKCRCQPRATALDSVAHVLRKERERGTNRDGAQGGRWFSRGDHDRLLESRMGPLPGSSRVQATGCDLERAGRYR
jgi:hypothetical protein